MALSEVLCSGVYVIQCKVSLTMRKQNSDSFTLMPPEKVKIEIAKRRFRRIKFKVFGKNSNTRNLIANYV